MDFDFEEIEDLMVSKLKTKMRYLRTVDSYEGQLEVDDLKKMVMKFPASFVVYRGGPHTWVDGPNHNHAPTFAVFCAAKNLKGAKTARKDSDKGAYRILKDVIKHLTNQDFGLEMEKLVPTRTYLVFTSGSFIVYGVDFKTNFDTTYL